jgi:hypothetical protein
MPDRVGQVFQRLEVFRDRAEEMLSRAERFLNTSRAQAASRPAPAPRPPAPPQPSQGSEPPQASGSD